VSVLRRGKKKKRRAVVLPQRQRQSSQNMSNPHHSQNLAISPLSLRSFLSRFISTCINILTYQRKCTWTFLFLSFLLAYAITTFSFFSSSQSSHFYVNNNLSIIIFFPLKITEIKNKKKNKKKKKNKREGMVTYPS
jgi:hypothetical protein